MSPVDAVRRWVDEVVVGLDLCPWAAGALKADQVRFELVTPDSIGHTVELIGNLFFTLDEGEQVLAVVPALADWEDFLDVVDGCEALIDQAGLDWVQLAHFHPDYLFEGLEPDDPANRTNRAPAPAIHILQVADVARAVAAHPDAAGIGDRNAEKMRARYSE